MNLILLPELANLRSSLNDSEQRMILTEVTWTQYGKLLQALGDSSIYRITYLNGILEIMSPSRRHEICKKNIARLLEVYLEEVEIDFWGLGSTTFREKEGKVGKEPDESYCLETEKELPDLVIEVIITSGSIKILEVYRRLEIQEIWLWQDEQLKIYCLKNNQYSLQEKSRLLPNLDLHLFCQFINYPNPRLGIKEF
ncbi:MAG: Uma2 family endonuclease, partial [Cyanobacteria bacterium P01_G01_bin.49]